MIQRGRRHCGLESLEQRAMLSAQPPLITNAALAIIVVASPQ
jgi:hypothetical protein